MAIIFGFGLGTLILALALAWALRQYSRRSRTNDAVTDAATMELYEHPDRYAARTHDEIQARTEP